MIVCTQVKVAKLKNYGILCCYFLLIVACSKNQLTEVPAILPELKPEAQWQRVWFQHTQAEEEGQYLRITPVSDGERLYHVTDTGTLWVQDIKTGKKLWRRPLQVPVGGGLTLTPSYLYLGTLDGQVLAVDKTEGTIKWQVQVSSEVLAVPAVDGRRVIVQTIDGSIHALKITDGRLLWTYSTQTPMLTLRGTSAPKIHSGAVIAGFSNGKVAIINIETGSLIWEQPIVLPEGRSEFERLADIDGHFVIKGSTLYIASYQGHVMAMNLYQGKVLWERELSTYLDLVFADERLFIIDSDAIIWALDATSGSVLWRQDGLKWRQLTAPALSPITADRMAVADFEGYVHVLSIVDGRFITRRQIDRRGLRTTPLWVGEYIVTVGNSGGLSALRLRP